MATAGESGEAGEKLCDCKRPFRREINVEPWNVNEESQNVSQEEKRNNSSGVSELGGNPTSISAASGISELEQMLKEKTFTRSETQHLIALLQSRTIEESATPLLSHKASTSGSQLKKRKYGNERDTFHASVVSSRDFKEEIASPAELARAYKSTTIGTGQAQAQRQDSKSINNNAAGHLKTEMASPQHPTTIENLPNEILANIFIRLFAKQLAQMRSVNKSWNALLSQSSFIKAHLSHSIHHKEQILLLFCNASSSFDYKRFTTLPYRSPHLKLTNFIKLPPINPQSRFKGIRIIGSVNGLICSSYDNGSVIHIWNPSLSAMLTLPPYSMPSVGYDSIRIYLRFGYDPKTDDYKVVKITGLNREPGWSTGWWLDVEVYSMRKGSWKVITERFPSHIRWIHEDDRVCLDGHGGHLHWVGSIAERILPIDRIVAFDLGSETFHEIPLPEATLGYRNGYWSKLGVLDGMPCLLARRGDGLGTCEVWMMEEYGVAESWVKRHVFSELGDNTCLLGFTSHNELLFYNNSHNLVLFNPAANKTETFKNSLPGKGGADKIVEYVDSLVWVSPAKHEMVNDACET